MHVVCPIPLFSVHAAYNVTDQACRSFVLPGIQQDTYYRANISITDIDFATWEIHLLAITISNWWVWHLSWWKLSNLWCVLLHTTSRNCTWNTHAVPYKVSIFIVKHMFMQCKWKILILTVTCAVWAFLLFCTVGAAIRPFMTITEQHVTQFAQ